MEKAYTTIRPVPPFDFELTAGYHTYFQGRYGTDSLTDGVYRRLLDLDGTLVLASVSSAGDMDNPLLDLELQGDSLGPAFVEQAAQRVSWLLGVGQDLAPFYDMAGKDAILAGMTERFNGLHLPHTSSVFEALVLAIMGQQISTHVARVIRGLFIETHGPRLTIDGETYYAFPRPETLAAQSVDDLRQLKLSQRKAEYVHGIACAALEDPTGMEGLHRLSDEEVIKQTVALRGVGAWTAQWLLIRALGRPDALPLGDLALRRVVSRMYFNGEEVNDRQVEDFAERWRPWRTYATVYMFTSMRTGAA
jgi:DNA-3-methyladenine glycosylase II